MTTYPVWRANQLSKPPLYLRWTWRSSSITSHSEDQQCIEMPSRSIELFMRSKIRTRCSCPSYVRAGVMMDRINHVSDEDIPIGEDYPDLSGPRVSETGFLQITVPVYRQHWSCRASCYMYISHSKTMVSEKSSALTPSRLDRHSIHSPSTWILSNILGWEGLLLIEILMVRILTTSIMSHQ